jgi:hypothetical protein
MIIYYCLVDQLPCVIEKIIFEKNTFDISVYYPMKISKILGLTRVIRIKYIRVGLKLDHFYFCRVESDIFSKPDRIRPGRSTTHVSMKKKICIRRAKIIIKNYLIIIIHDILNMKRIMDTISYHTDLAIKKNLIKNLSQ